jgi:sarcosine oxidase
MLNGGRAEVAVVGAGVVGLAASTALVEVGVDVRCFEHAEPGSGQSAGRTRVFRHVHDRADLVALVREARAGWDAWSERAGRPLLGDEGVLYAAPDVEAAAALLADSGVEYRWASEDEQWELLPVLAPPAEVVLLDVRGGALRVGPTIDALASWVGDRLVRAEVLSVRPDGEGVELLTGDGLWRCERVLLCAGVRTAELARPLGIDIPLAVSLHIRLAFPVREEHRGRLACWLDRTGHYGAAVYAGPVARLDAYAVGLATRDQLADDADVATVRGYVERGLPGLHPEPLEARPCWVTILPWHGDAFAAWQAGPVLAFAGHNLFKLAPLLGGLLAGAARSGRVPPSSALRLHRSRSGDRVHLVRVVQDCRLRSPRGAGVVVRCDRME